MMANASLCGPLCISLVNTEVQCIGLVPIKFPGLLGFLPVEVHLCCGFLTASAGIEHIEHACHASSNQRSKPFAKYILYIIVWKFFVNGGWQAPLCCQRCIRVTSG